MRLVRGTHRVLDRAENKNIRKEEYYQRIKALHVHER